MTESRIALRLGFPALAASAIIVGFVSAPALPQTEKAADGWVLTVPKRRAADAPPAVPPPLPPAAESITPTTIEIAVRRGPTSRGSKALRQTVARTSERIHLTGEDRREWLFERNPVDPRRVSATMTEHPSKTIVLYGESDLRMSLGIRGWADVLALGFNSQLLAGYKRTQDVRTLGGIRFARHTNATKSAESREVWWSDEQVLASSFEIHDGTGVARFSVERARPGVDSALLRPPQERFPTYRTVDVGDWLEKH
jgi:hypothetical protein